MLFSDPLGQVAEVLDVEVDGSDRVLLSDRRTNPEFGRLWRLDQGTLSHGSFTDRGVGLAIDPLTADIFIAQEGRPSEPGGEVLRVDASSLPPRAGNWRGAQEYETFSISRDDGDLAFSDDGSFYVNEGDTGRIWRVDRSSGTRSLVGGNYQRPSGMVLAPGRAGTAGSQGTSLFVLDGHAIWEVGVDDLPAPAPPDTPPGLAPIADLRVTGSAAPGSFLPIAIDQPSEALRPYVLVPTVNGKSPGFPLALLGNPSDGRIVPTNLGPALDWIGDSGILPVSVGLLSPTGQSSPSMGLMIPNDAALFSQDLWVDFCWLAFSTSFQNGISFVGGTAQVYLGL